MAGRISNTLVTIAGADPGIMERTPTCRSKYERIGAFVLIAAALAATGFTIMLSLAFDPEWWALAFGWCAWVGVTVGVEMLLLGHVNIDPSSSRKAIVWALMPRLALTVVLSFLSTTFIILGMFPSGVMTEARRQQAVAADTFQSTLATGARTEKLEKARAQLAAARDVAAGRTGDAVSANPDFQALDAKIATKQVEYDKALIDVSCEVNGTGACSTGTPTSGDPGPGQRYDVKRERADNLAAELRALRDEQQVLRRRLEAESSGRKQTLVAQANRDIARLEPIVEQLTAQLEADQRKYAEGDTIGLEGRLAALKSLAVKNLLSVGLYVIVVELLLVIVELLSLLVKVSMLKKGDLYQREFTRVEAATERRLEYEDTLQKTMDAAQLDAELAKSKAAAEAYVETLTALFGTALELWAEEETKKIKADHRAWLNMP